MEFTAQNIANLVNGTVEGDANVCVDSFCKIEEGRPGAISFLANPKYAHFIYDTKASVVLVADDFEPQMPISATLIRVADPYQTIAKLLEVASQAAMQHPTGVEQPSFVAADAQVGDDAYIGAFAYIGAGAKIGKGAKIYPQSYIGAGCSVGEDTVIYPGVKVYVGCTIGSNCIIHSGAVIGADGFGFAPDAQGVYNKIPQMGNVAIADNVEIGANTTIDRAMMGSTRIGKGVKLDNLVQIAHNVEVGDNTVMAAQAGVAGSAKIGSGCMLGGQVGVAGHITVGDGTQVGAQSGIPNNVKPGSRIMGYPAVPALTFARQTALLRRLPDLFDQVASIEKTIKSQN